MLDKELLLKKANEYLNNEKQSDFRIDLQKVIDSKDFDELNDRFYTELAFGTGGMRGLIGGGINRMNPYVLSRAAQGLANYVNIQKKGEKSAVIAYDSRNYSDVFAKEIALVLAANGIKAYLFSSLRPTPELSFAIRYLKATTGAVVTASHNPKEYNGLKVYWENGSQIIYPHDEAIIEQVHKVGDNINTISEDEAIKKGLFQYVDKEIDNAFVSMVKKYSLRPDMVKKQSVKTKIVYTPLNGTGKMLVERILSEMGISVITVPEQGEPDGNFPTCPFPNPEIAQALKLALELGSKEKADIVMGTDPDADRLGIAVPNATGWELISGNQLGVLLAHYVLSSKKELGTLPPKPAIIKTIVTTKLADRVAESFGTKCVDVLTGFKWIAAQMEKYEDEGYNFIMGYEESYGFLFENEVRDKDAVGAASMSAEMALYCASQDKSVLDYLNEIYFEYGYFEEFQISKVFKGESGLNVMQGLMDDIRNNPLTEIGGNKVVLYRDFLNQTEKNMVENSLVKLTLPKSNVLQFELEDNSVFTVRPSGTEPKIKFYGSCCSDPKTELIKAKNRVADKILAIKESVTEILTDY